MQTPHISTMAIKTETGNSYQIKLGKKKKKRIKKKAEQKQGAQAKHAKQTKRHTSFPEESKTRSPHFSFEFTVLGTSNDNLNGTQKNRTEKSVLVCNEMQAEYNEHSKD